MTARCRLLSVIIDLDGGAGVFCRNLNTGLQKYYGDEFDLSLLMLRNRALVENDRAIFNSVCILERRVDRDWRRLVQTLLHAAEIKREIRAARPDAILTVGVYPNMLVPPVAGKARCILTVHSNTTQQLQDSSYGGLLRPLLRWRYSRSTVVAPSQGVADDLKQNFSATDTRVIHHGIDLDRIATLANETPADLPTRPYIVAVGRLTSAKDYPTLLRAFDLLQKRGAQNDLVIVGDGELRDELIQRTASMGLHDRVHFLGHRGNPYPYMKHASLFALSSIWEGFGLSLIEAMSLGTPVVSTDCPSGPAEILSGGKDGLLVPPSNPSQFAAAVLDILGNPDRRRELSARSAQRAQDFSLKQMAAQYRQLFLHAPSAVGR